MSEAELARDLHAVLAKVRRVDATCKWPEEGFQRPWPKVIRMDDDVKRRVDELWKPAGLGG